MSEKSHPVTHINFEGPGLKGDGPSLSIAGIPSDHLKRPEKIRKLMELLDLPEGTKAQIISTVSDVVVR
jgi:hypothetical protein